MRGRKTDRRCAAGWRWTVRAAAAVALATAGACGVAHVRAADVWTIQLGVRETGSADPNAPIGSNGGTTGDIEWITSSSPTITPADGWKQFTWNFSSDPVTPFTGNGVLSANNNKAVLEHIRIVNSGGNVGGDLRLRIDDVVNTVSGTPTAIGSGFETAPLGNNDFTMFREPIFSSSTLANMSTGTNSTLISTASVNSGERSLAARWSFVPNGSTSQWLRLTTNNATLFGNPVIDIGPNSSLSIALNMQVYQPTSNRVRGMDASQFQGTGHDWNRVAAPQSAGGAGLTFAFLRSTRGGTSGTSTTGSRRLDDPEYAANIAGAKAAALLTGPYHFPRWDQWTPNDATGSGDAPDSVGTPEDDARHMLRIAGRHMKVGYMRPVFDLEDPNTASVEPHTVPQLTSYVHRFADTIKKYKGPAAQIIVYTGANHSSRVDSTVAAQYPLWMPRFLVEAEWADGDPFPTDSSYGAWGDADPDNEKPWKFWQYNSPDVYIPGITSGTHNDIDVAHGDITLVRQYLIQGAIWDGSSNNQWTANANWHTDLAPTGSTEVAFDLGIPVTGATIALTSGRSAGGVYFADSYTLSGGTLTLTDGRIDVDAAKTASILTNLATPNGFRKVGLGNLNHTGGTSSVTGAAQVLQGTLNVSGGSLAIGGDLLVNPELTQFDKSLVEPFPVDASEISSAALTINGGAMTAFAAYVGGTDTAPGAIGMLNVSSGSLAVTGPLKIWNSAVPMVDSKVNLSGGTLSVGSLDTDGDAASFNWTGGIFAVTGAGGLSVASGGPVGPSLTVGTGKQLIVFNPLAVGGSSTVTLQNSGAITVGSLDVGGVQSRFSWTGGTLTINGPGATDFGTRTIGVGGTPMFLNINGGSVTNAALTVGALSNGALDHAGGTHTVSTLNVGVGTATAGTHSVRGSAALSVTGNENVGGTASAASGGTGILNVSGGVAHIVGALKIWDSGPAAPAGTRVNLTGGTLSVGAIDFDSNPARFNFAGGTLEYRGPGASDFTGVTVGPAATLNIVGGTVDGAVLGPDLSVATGGVLHVQPAGTLAAPTTNNGLLSINGGAVTAAVHNNAAMQIAGTGTSTFDNTATVDNAGTIDVNTGASVIFNAGVAGPGTINVAAGATMNTVVVASATLNVNGTLTVSPSWPGPNAAINLTVGGRLDLNDNKLIVFGGDVGTSNGSTYSGLTGRIQSAHNGGAWDGNGITTGLPDAPGGLTSLGIATAEETSYAGGDFMGVPVEAGDVLIMYTYAGDANLDGLISGDDYSAIDFNILVPGSSGWVNGDFNYDGAITGDDYSAIDFNILAQGAPFPTTGSLASASRATAVPEPTGAGLLAVASGALFGRRRRRLRPS